MNKPDGLPDSDWARSAEVMRWIEAFLADGLHQSEIDEVREAIALAMLAARSEECERCATLAERMETPYMLAVRYIAAEQNAKIAEAIRGRE